MVSKPAQSLDRWTEVKDFYSNWNKNAEQMFDLSFCVSGFGAQQAFGGAGAKGNGIWDEFDPTV